MVCCFACSDNGTDIFISVNGTLLRKQQNTVYLHASFSLYYAVNECLWCSLSPALATVWSLVAAPVAWSLQSHGEMSSATKWSCSGARKCFCIHFCVVSSLLHPDTPLRDRGGCTGLTEREQNRAVLWSHRVYTWVHVDTSVLPWRIILQKTEYRHKIKLTKNQKNWLTASMYDLNSTLKMLSSHTAWQNILLLGNHFSYD